MKTIQTDVAVIGAGTAGLAAYRAAIAAGKMRRDEAECGLAFCGFLVLHCPPKPESKAVLEALSTSGHTLQMLTGDSLLTATHTAHSLGHAAGDTRGEPLSLARIKAAAERRMAKMFPPPQDAGR